MRPDLSLASFFCGLTDRSWRRSAPPQKRRRQGKGLRCESSSDRENVRVFRLFERKTRFNRREAVDARQLLLQEAVVGFKVRDNNAQQIIARPGHEITFEHFRPLCDRLFETLERFDALALK